MRNNVHIPSVNVKRSRGRNSARKIVRLRNLQRAENASVATQGVKKACKGDAQEVHGRPRLPHDNDGGLLDVTHSIRDPE
jgi:hypothetical protein